MFEMDRKEIYIYDLAVAPKHKRKGVGSNLLKNLRSIARTSGAYVVFVKVDE